MMNLHEELDLLREENRQLKQRLWLDLAGAELVRMQKILRTQPQCARLLNALMLVPLGRREHLFEAMIPQWVNSDTDIKCLDVRICMLRRVLRPHGIEIETVWGVGYRLAPEMKARLRDLLELEEAA